MNDSHLKTFVTTEALAENQTDYKCKIIDLRDFEKFKSGHINGSIHIDNNIFAKQNEEGINILPDKNSLIQALQEKGINKEDHLVLVDDVFNLNCSLAAWTLHYFGFYNVNLLDGAFAKWLKEERELTNEVFSYPSGDINFEEENEDILVTKDDILMNINSEDILYVDNRSEYPLRFEQNGGNIPGAIHYWYLDLFK
ncbi:MAG: sulfurtransferase, partial [Candidatus Heimdallarchaeaceae archaeon]